MWGTHSVSLSSVSLSSVLLAAKYVDLETGMHACVEW